MEDNIINDDKENLNEDNQVFREEFKRQEVMPDEEKIKKKKKIIIILVVIGVLLIITAITLILVFTLKKSDEILQPLIFNSTSGNHTHTIIFMPGLTNQPEHFKRFFVNSIQFTKKNDTTIIILRSPSTYVTALNEKTYSWFNIFKLPLTDFSDINLDELKTTSAKVLEKVINNEVNILNGDYSKIIIGGHSQGAMMSLYQTYFSNKAYGGLFAFSGILPPGDISDDKKKMKTWIGYGDKDNVIDPGFMNRTLQRIEHFEGVEMRIYPNHNHTINKEERKDASKFLDKIIK